MKKNGNTNCALDMLILLISFLLFCSVSYGVIIRQTTTEQTYTNTHGDFSNMQYQIFDIDPVTKPRMTQRDRWKKRPCVEKYNRFKDVLREMNTSVPDSGYHVLFVLKMPVKWTRKKKNEMRFRGCQETPDKDNLEKALLDGIFKNDAHIWDGRCSKVWGDSGKIIIITGIDTGWISEFLKDIL